MEDLKGEGDLDPFSLDVVSSPPMDIASGDETDFLVVKEVFNGNFVSALRKEFSGGVPVLTQFGFTLTEI